MNGLRTNARHVMPFAFSKTYTSGMERQSAKEKKLSC